MSEILNLLVCAYFGVTGVLWMYSIFSMYSKTDSNKLMVFLYPLAWPLVIIFAIGISCFAAAMAILEKGEPSCNNQNNYWCR